MATILTLAEKVQRQLIVLERMSVLSHVLPFVGDELDVQLKSAREFARASEMMSEIVAQTNAIFTGSRSIDELRRHTADIETLFSSVQRWRAELLALEPSAIALGERGWTVPMWTTPNRLQFILTLGAAVDLDDWFSDAYAADSGAAETALFQRLLGDPALANRRPLIEECIEDYRGGRYLAPLPALVAMFEGVLIEFAGPSWVTSTRVADVANRLKNDAAPSTSLVAWASMVGFASEVFANSRFDGPHPGKLSRHWVLHGRDPGTWRRVDCLRMLHALDTLCSVTSIMNAMRAQHPLALPAR